MTTRKLVAHAPVELDWVAGSEFEAGRSAGPRIRLDGDARTAPSPFDALLAAIAACSGTDVVAILRKQRTPVQVLHVRVEAHRVETVPRRLAAAALHFSISAPGATAQKVARAVELSITKYCSVRSSLASDIAVTWSIDLKD